jgi:hypothetical protein
VQLLDYVNDVQEILHDSTSSSWPISRVISRINEARLDTARDTHCVRRNITGIQLLPDQETYSLVGAVAGANVTSSGSNYGSLTTVIPVTFTAAPPGGITATAIGNVVGGKLASITMTQWGQGYTSIPTVTIGGVGSGAAAVPVCLFRANPLSPNVGGPIVVLVVSFLWNQSRKSLRYYNFSMFQAYARSPLNFDGPPDVFTQHQQDQLIYVQPPPDQTYYSEWDIIFMPAPLVAMTDVDNDIVDPWARAVQFRAAENLLMKHQNWGMVNSLGQKYDAFVPRVLTTSGGIRVPNPYNRNLQRRALR